MESFFGSLKNEWYSRFAFKTRGEARMDVIWYVESLCNRTRALERGLEEAGRAHGGVLREARLRLGGGADGGVIS